MKKNKTIVEEFCKRHNLTEDQFYGREKVGGYLYLGSVTSLPDGFNPTVGGGLDLRSVTSLPDGFNPTVGGYLDLGSVTSLPDGFNPTVGGGLDLGSVTSLPDGFNPTVGGGLDLGSVTSLPDGFNPTVGGGLYLGSMTSLPDGFNPTVGGDLYLRSVTSLPEGFNPTVGGYLDLPSDLRKKVAVKKPGKIITPRNKLLFWQDGKYVSADRIFTEVLSRKGNVFKVRRLHSTKEFYLVSDGTTHAHGETLQKAKEDFRFKLMAEKLKSEPIKADTVIDIKYYRLLTGACEMGVKSWMEQNKMTKESYKASELLPVLKKTHAYGVEKFESLVAF
jgi:hypothetical protein